MSPSKVATRLQLSLKVKSMASASDGTKSSLSTSLMSTVETYWLS
jgi:hypothetical protein